MTWSYVIPWVATCHACSCRYLTLSPFLSRDSLQFYLELHLNSYGGEENACFYSAYLDAAVLVMQITDALLDGQSRKENAVTDREPDRELDFIFQMVKFCVSWVWMCPKWSS